MLGSVCVPPNLQDALKIFEIATGGINEKQTKLTDLPAPLAMTTGVFLT